MAPLLVFLAVVFGYGLLSGRLKSTALTGPMVYSAAGLICGIAIAAESRLDFDLDLLLWPAKLALALVLFTTPHMCGSGGCLCGSEW